MKFAIAIWIALNFLMIACLIDNEKEIGHLKAHIQLLSQSCSR